MAQVFMYDSTGEAYDDSQTNDLIRDGDVLVVESEGAVAILVEAWPTAIEATYAGESFHVLGDGYSFSALPRAGGGPDKDYSESVALARREAAAMDKNPSDARLARDGYTRGEYEEIMRDRYRGGA